MRRDVRALVLATGIGVLLGVGNIVSAVPTTDIPLESLDVEDLSGQRWTVDRIRGRVVVIDFWATWCAPCLADLPRLKSLRERHAREHFEIIGVALDSLSRRSLVSWLNRHRIDWPQVHERNGYQGRLARQFGVDRLPSSVLVDRQGAIVAVNLRGDQLASRVDELIMKTMRPDGGAR